MRLSSIPAILVAAGLTAAAGTGRAATVTFESAPASFTSYTDQGATFTAVGGGSIFTLSGSPNGTKAILGANSTHQELRADIAGGTSFVSVDLGDFNQDADTIFLEVFNSSDVSLGFTSALLPSSFTGMQTLSLSTPNIAYAVFGARAPALGGSSVYADNFTFTAAGPAQAPLPSTAWAGLLLVAALGVGRWFFGRTASC